ncbi:MAG TPA: hypothetical protein VFQ38_13135 [Longimicrobiales bacterium]|nr:hypothetical protein [Longimicrobiales bacterium]
MPLLLPPVTRRATPPHSWTSARAGRPAPGPHGRLRRALAAAVTALAAATACRPAAPAFGDTRQQASANAESFFGAFAARYTNVQRTPKFAAARGKLGRHALSPSGVFGDTSVWTAAAGDTRTLTVSGRLRGNRYVFDASATAPAPQRPGDSWHYMRLRKLPTEDVFEWVTAVDMATGGASPDQLRDVWRALLASAVRTPAEPLLRAEYRAVTPRATHVLGQLATLDSLAVRPLGDGTAVVALSVSLHPERLKARYPAFGQYVSKYVEPARYALTFEDRRGGRWLVTTARKNRLTFRLRATADGRMAPLDGPVRPMPDTLVMRGEAWAKFSIFTIGMTELTADVALIDGSDERGWEFRFREEPDWHFPLAVNHLISAALRRPFAEEGMQLRITARERDDGQTIIGRRVLVNVQEGAIVRWLGGLGAGAMDDFAGRAEEDENRFLADLFAALQDDFATLLLAGGA